MCSSFSVLRRYLWPERVLVAGGCGLLAAGGCTLADVTVPASDDLLVVEAVLRTDVASQAILLHRAVQGRLAAGEPGAEVVVSTPGGGEIRFAEAGQGCVAIDPAFLAQDSLDVRATCYASPESAGRWVQPGGTYELTIRTRGGEVVRGRTVVPGAFGLLGMPFRTRADQPLSACAIPPNRPYPVTWTQAEGAWAYVAPLRIVGLVDLLPPGVQLPDTLELIGLSVASADTQLVLPQEFGVFDRFRYDQELLRLLQQGLPQGVVAGLTVAAADRNYVNGVRGGNFNPSGLVRIASVAGDGTGVFGSLVPVSVEVQVREPSSAVPACGGG